ncbi:MAG: polysaccharide deacetylase [Candidatus Andersenbacteria bacterium CG10_big_fil_rev_8_21_14_0_10_54_11]|uniref:Polysaccharide deacetylase n=1 Tax=Candidatus Andersenbacteria bacterium CG10_big_fil_rev_8_21_14_0_10_54_11 TaxID=1974485 RepID=A0A2M6WZQ1_9BACT|nr:MAG: polysaccharide deacetylase [Candidatus Andersenbacteria bacterium CG10_big_fil_rev_8_21_14_0_10_54_11]
MLSVHIVTYHYVRPLAASRYPAIKGREVDSFRDQVRLLQQRFSLIRMEELSAALAGYATLPRQAALLTFDDGYRDHFDYVFPVLDEQGVQGSFFIPVEAVFERKLLDVNKIHLIVASAPIKQILQTIAQEFPRLEQKHEVAPLAVWQQELAGTNRFDDPQVSFVKRLLQYGLPDAPRRALLDQLFSTIVRVPERTAAEELYMTLEQIKTIQRHGMHIGSHGYGHYRLSALSPAAQEEDLSLAAKRLQAEGLIPRTGWAMCYPYGDASVSAAEWLERNGCAVAFTTEHATARLEKGSRMRLPRWDTNQVEELVLKAIGQPI